MGGVLWTTMGKRLVLITLKLPRRSITWHSSTTSKGSTSKPNRSTSERWRAERKCSHLITHPLLLHWRATPACYDRCNETRRLQSSNNEPRRYQPGGLPS